MPHAIAARTKANSTSPCRPAGVGGMGGSGRERGTAPEGAVVVTLTVTFVPAAAGFGDTEQMASEGAPVQAKDTFPDNPPSAPTLKV